MKSLYESILSTTNSGKKAMFKSFTLQDIHFINSNIKLNKIFDISKMKKYLETDSDIIVFNNDKHARIFAKFLCSVDFTLKEWEILKIGSIDKKKEIDEILKSKLEPYLKKKTVNDYSLCLNSEKIYISINNDVNQKELVGDVLYRPSIVWFNNNFKF
jgi:hypothetical protein